ncbi:hypothetical protein AB0J89_10510 [Micromonospora chokoriensis]
MALSVGRHDHVSVPGRTTTQDETVLTVNTRTSACADTVLLPPRGANADAFGHAEEVSSLRGLLKTLPVGSMSLNGPKIAGNTVSETAPRWEIVARWAAVPLPTAALAIPLAIFTASGGAARAPQIV